MSKTSSENKIQEIPINDANCFYFVKLAGLFARAVNCHQAPSITTFLTLHSRDVMAISKQPDAVPTDQAQPPATAVESQGLTLARFDGSFAPASRPEEKRKLPWYADREYFLASWLSPFLWRAAVSRHNQPPGQWVADAGINHSSSS